MGVHHTRIISQFFQEVKENFKLSSVFFRNFKGFFAFSEVCTISIDCFVYFVQLIIRMSMEERVIAVSVGTKSPYSQKNQGKAEML